MVGEDIGNQVASNVNTAISIGGNVLIWVFLAVLVVALIGLWFWMSSFNKKKVQLYEKINNSYRIRYWKAKEIKVKGVKKWMMFGNWKKVSQPPSECVYTDVKGHDVAIGYLIDDNIVWAKKIDFNVNDESLAGIKFDPFLAEDKVVVSHEYREAQDYRKKKWTDVLMALSVPITLVLILAVFMIFFHNAVAPTIELSNHMIESQKEMSSIITKLDVLINNRRIEQQSDSSGLSVVPN